MVTDETLAAIEQANRSGKLGIWRVSSTVFSQIASDEILQPISPLFATPEAKTRFPPIACGVYVQQELEAINLKEQKGV